MIRLFVILLVLIVVVLTIYGSVKLFHEVRAEWRDWRSRRDSKAAEARARAEVFEALPGRLIELFRLHNDLGVQFKRLSQRLECIEEGNRKRRLSQIELQGELSEIRKALKGYI